MTMGVNGINNSALLAQLEKMKMQMNQHMQAVNPQAMNNMVQMPNAQQVPSVLQNAQGTAAVNMVQMPNQQLDANNINNQAPYLNGAKAAQAFNHVPENAAFYNNPAAAAAEALFNTPLQQTTSAGQAVGEFKQLLKDAFETVNNHQNQAGSLASRFDVGDRSVTLADVMIASQKSSLSFEATIQIRNKIVDAYQSIMQMPI